MRYAEDLLPVLERAEMKAVAVRPERAREACGDVTERRRRGETDPRVSERFFGRFVTPEYLATPEWAKSLLVVAIPSSASVVRFDAGNGSVEATIPPTMSVSSCECLRSTLRPMTVMYRPASSSGVK